MLMLPWLIGRTLSDVAVTIGIFVLMGLGLNIAIGLAGLLDLGYLTNYAVGAYMLAVLTSIGPLGLFKGTFTFWMVIPLALLAAMFAGFIFRRAGVANARRLSRDSHIRLWRDHRQAGDLRLAEAFDRRRARGAGDPEADIPRH